MLRLKFIIYFTLLTYYNFIWIKNWVILLNSSIMNWLWLIVIKFIKIQSGNMYFAVV